MNFELNNYNVTKINERMQSIKNRLHKLAQIKEKLQEELIKWKIDGGMTSFKNINRVFDKKFTALKNTAAIVKKGTESRLSKIEKLRNGLKNKEFTLNELAFEIKHTSKIKQPTEAILHAKREQFKNRFLVSKIELKTNKPIPNSFRRQVININNEIIHINNALMDVRELSDNAVKEYNSARLAAFKDSYQQKTALASMDGYQSMVEFIAGFNVIETGRLVSERLSEMNDTPFYQHINCNGKTGFC